MAKLEEALQKISVVQDELLAASRADEKRIIEALTGAVSAVSRDKDVFEVVEDCEEVTINTDAEELIITAGEGCIINLNGDIGIVRVEAGGGSSVVFNSNVGGANITQGAGGDCQICGKVDSLSIKQGPGSNKI